MAWFARERDGKVTYAMPVERPLLSCNISQSLSRTCRRVQECRHVQECRMHTTHSKVNIHVMHMYMYILFCRGLNGYNGHAGIIAQVYIIITFPVFSRKYIFVAALFVLPVCPDDGIYMYIAGLAN